MQDYSVRNKLYLLHEAMEQEHDDTSLPLIPVPRNFATNSPLLAKEVSQTVVN